MDTSKREPVTHYLKTIPPFFQDAIEGIKPFEVRKDDRDFRVGDILILEEWDSNRTVYTGRKASFDVTYKLVGETWGLMNGVCVMGIIQKQRSHD